MVMGGSAAMVAQQWWRSDGAAMAETRLQFLSHFPCIGNTNLDDCGVM
jgi:hypothetical protein